MFRRDRARPPGVVHAVGAATTFLLTLSTVALAHATLVSSEPAAHARLSESPRRVRLVFSEPIEPRLGQISIAGSDGRSMRLMAVGDPRDVHALVAPTELLPAGAYRVAWRVVSADGHPVEGSFVFSIAAASAVVEPRALPPPSTAGEAASWGASVAGAPVGPATLRGLAVGCLMGACGLLFFLTFSGVPGLAQRRPARIALWLSALAPLLLGAHLSAWMVNVAPGHGLDIASISSTLTTTVGRVELFRAALALLALWAIALARRLRLALVFTFAALAMSGATGHSVAIAPMWAAPAKALHLVAASAWLGGLLWLLLLDWKDHQRVATEAGRVSSIALASIVIVAISGAVQALLFIPSPADLVRSTYGALTLAKLAGLTGLVAFGTYHRRRVLPRLANPGVAGAFHTSLAREVALMAALVLIGGLLAYVPPPADAHLPVTHASHP